MSIEIQEFCVREKTIHMQISLQIQVFHVNSPHRAMEIWLVWKLISGWAVFHTQFTMDFLCPLKFANVIVPLATELMSVHIYSCLAKFCRQNTVISTWVSCKVQKVHYPVSAHIQVGHANSPSWTTESCLIWKRFLGDQCFIHLYWQWTFFAPRILLIFH